MPRKTSRRTPAPNVAPLAALLGTSPAAGAVRFTFDCMSIAEQEISRAKLGKAAGSVAFAALAPSAPLIGKATALYRVHAAEICARVRTGAPLAPATDAECLAVCSDTSLKAPPHAGAARAFAVLFERCFPWQAPPGSIAEESWKGRTAEIIAELRRKFAVPARDTNRLIAWRAEHAGGKTEASKK